MTKDNDSAKLDDLLKRTQAAQEASARTNLPPPKKGIIGRGGAPANDSSPTAAETAFAEIRETLDDVRGLARFVRDTKTAFGGFKDKFLDPVWSVVNPPFKFAWNCYKGIWNRYAYDHDKETGEKTLSRTKAGILLTATFAAAVAATPTLPGDMIRYVTVEPVTDAVVMMMTMKHSETVYQMKSQEIDPANNIHRVQGCLTPVCSPSQTVTYNLEPRLSHTVWNMATNGHPFFMTDRIAAAIPPGGNNKCEVTSYSARFAAAKYLQIFPQMLDVRCEAMSAPAPAPTPGG